MGAPDPTAQARAGRRGGAATARRHLAGRSAGRGGREAELGPYQLLRGEERPSLPEAPRSTAGGRPDSRSPSGKVSGSPVLACSGLWGGAWRWWGGSEAWHPASWMGAADAGGGAREGSGVLGGAAPGACLLPAVGAVAAVCESVRRLLPSCCPVQRAGEARGGRGSAQGEGRRGDGGPRRVPSPPHPARRAERAFGARRRAAMPEGRCAPSASRCCRGPGVRL